MCLAQFSKHLGLNQDFFACWATYGRYGSKQMLVMAVCLHLVYFVKIGPTGIQQTPQKIVVFYLTKDGFWPHYVGFKHDYAP